MPPAVFGRGGAVLPNGRTPVKTLRDRRLADSKTVFCGVSRPADHRPFSKRFTVKTTSTHNGYRYSARSRACEYGKRLAGTAVDRNTAADGLFYKGKTVKKAFCWLWLAEYHGMSAGNGRNSQPVLAVPAISSPAGVSGRGQKTKPQPENTTSPTSGPGQPHSG